MKKINKKELHEIFEELRNKNQNAYNKLYENYYSLVYGIVFSILKNKEDSEDLTHEIFTKIYKLDVNKLPTNNEASWLFTVSKNECFLHLRKAKPNISIDEIYEMPCSSNCIDDVIDSEYYNKLMEGLKEDEKLIVSLKILANFTFKKISQIMNIPIGTVQWKYYNAINSLRVSLGSLVGAVIAFVIVLARGEFWRQKDYLNENINNNDVSSNDMFNDNLTDSKQELEDINSFVTNNEQDLNKGDNLEQNVENSSQNTQVNQDVSSKNEGTDINDENNKINEDSSEDNKTNEGNNRLPNDKLEDNKNIIQNATADVNTNTVGISNWKLDKIQSIFFATGIILIIISLIFFKIYQQKLKKKSSK